MRRQDKMWYRIAVVLTFVGDGHLAYLGKLTESRYSDVELKGVFEAVTDVFRESWIPDGGVVFITDATVHQKDVVFQFAEKFETDLSIASFEIPRGVLINDNNGRSSWFRRLEKLHAVTKHLTTVITSDDESFLTTLLDESFVSGLFVWPKRLLVITRNAEARSQQLQKLFSDTNSMVIVYEKATVRRCEILVYLPYSFRMITIAVWYHGYGIRYLTNLQFFPPKFDRFMDGTHLLASDDQFIPYVAVQLLPGILEDGEQNFTFTGPNMHLLEAFSQSMNFTYTLKRSPDRTWGYVQANGTATGMVGQLARKEVDLSLGPFVVTENRAQVMDYTVFISDDSLASMGATGSKEIDVLAFVNPLTFHVWLSLFASLFIVFSSVRLLATVTHFETYKRSFFWIRILLQQGTKQKCNKWWEKIISISWVVTTMVVVLSYSGNLMSLLAVRYIPQPFQTLDDILKDPHVTMVWEANTAYVLGFKKATSGSLREVKELDKRNKIKYAVSTEYVKYLETQVANGDHLLVLEAITIKMLLAEIFAATGVCQYYMSKGRFMPSFFAIGVQKKNPLRQALNKKITSITESGIYNHWLDTAVQNATTCLNAPSKVVIMSSLSIKNIWGIFMILAIGESISIFVLFTEIFMYKHNLDKKKTANFA